MAACNSGISVPTHKRRTCAKLYHGWHERSGKNSGDVIFAGDTGVGIIDQTKVGVRCFCEDLG